MRRIAVIFTLAGLLAAIRPAAAASDFWYGDVILLSRVELSPADPDAIPRCDFLVRGNASSENMGYVITLPDSLTDGAHRFTAEDGLMGVFDGLLDEPANVDVSFFSDLGACPGTGPEPVVVDRFFGPANEAGVVPAGGRYALVTIANKPGATFVFEVTH